MNIDLVLSVETQLKTIIENAISSGELNPELLRMIIITPNPTFDTLTVNYNNSWDKYYSGFEYSDGAEIGSISISTWLDEADTVFEKRNTLSDYYGKKAEEYNKKYTISKPAIQFDHIAKSNYKDYLICLREEVIVQIENAIKNVAISYTTNDFTHVVGFVTYKLNYSETDHLQIIAFNHPKGSGPFFNVLLSLPQTKLTYPFLKFYDKGFVLFYPESNIYEESDDQSNIYDYTIDNIKYAYINSGRREEVVFRLTDEFEDWELKGGHIDEEYGDLTEAQFFTAFKNFLNQYPEKILNIDEVPDPLIKNPEFQDWLTNIIENNLPVSYDHRESLLSYGEDAYHKLLNDLPETHRSWESVQQFLASHYFKQNNYQRSLDLLQSVKAISDYTKVHILQNLYYLDKKEEFDQLYQSLEEKSAKKEGMITMWLYHISLFKDQTDKLQELKSEIQDFIENNKGYIYEGKAAIALVKANVYLKETKEALLNFQKISFSYDINEEIFLKEFFDCEYVMDRYQEYLYHKQQKENFKAKTKTDSLIIPETDNVESPKSNYQDCFYVVKEIEDHGSDWVHPISQSLFLAKSQDNYVYLGEITKDYEVIKHDTIYLDNNDSYHYAFDNQTLYISHRDKGVIRYQIEDCKFKRLDDVIKNDQKIPKYGNLTVHDNHLFICNNEYLEIFDLSNPQAGPLSSSLFIDSGYNLFCNKDILVIGAGAGLVILIDIRDKAKPKYLSTIIEDQTPSNMHVEFVDHYLISRSVIDISDPTSPKFICHTKDELVPCFSYDNSLPKGVYVTEGYTALKTLKISESETKVTSWLPCYNESKEYDKRLTGNVATIVSENMIIGFTSYEISILRKAENPKYEKQSYTIQKPLDTMVVESFEYFLNTQPDFQVSKVVLRNEIGYGSITLALQGSSSPAVMLDPHSESEVPQMYTDFNFYLYFSQELDKTYNPENMSIQYDLNSAVNKIISDSRFSKIAAKHVMVVTDQDSRFIDFPEKNWSPYRKGNPYDKEKSILEILTSGNDNLLRKLKNEMNEDSTVFDELIAVLNTKTDEYDKAMEEAPIQNPDVLRPELPSYLQGPHLLYLQSQKTSPDIKAAKHAAFRVICSYKNRDMVKEVILNGAKYGIPSFTISPLPEKLNPNTNYIKLLVKNRYKLWDEFSEDISVKTFLLNQIETLDDQDLVAEIAFRYRLYTHKSIQDLLSYLLQEEHPALNYYTYTAQDNEVINFSILPVAALQPLEQELLAIYKAYAAAEPDIPYRLKELIIPVMDMLFKLGHEIFPESLLHKVENAKKYKEQFDDNMFEDNDDYESEEDFLLKLYRKQVIKKLISEFHRNTEQPIWHTQFPPEPYKKSWYNVFDLLMNEGKDIYGESFRQDFINRLTANIEKDEAYDTDRLLAFNFVHYTFKNIQDHPELASLTESLVIVINKNKDKFTDQIDLYKIKEKSKFALLQAAWNDLTSKNWDQAELKGNAILQMDPEFGQAYFLKARLLWLKEGIDQYLERKDEFIAKASHDAAALGRLYNLTGCALDIKKKYEDALPYFKKAALTATNEPMYIANIAEIYYKLNNADQALNYANKAKHLGYSSKMMDVIQKNKGVFEIDTYE